MSSNDVTITGTASGKTRIESQGGDLVRYLHADEVAALRAHFAAERMPEDVQALVEKAQVRTGEWTDIANATTDIRLIAGLAAALEAAYSQKGKAHEGA